MFELESTDLAGRVGKLKTRSGLIETPAILPVIHPARQTIPISRIASIGFQAVMTNAYLALKSYGRRAAEKGIHEVIGFDGTVMTDSGGYQVLEYGNLPVTPGEMTKFQEEIGSDIAIVLDRPTGFKVAKEYAEETVRLTLESARETLGSSSKRDTLWMGPVQGGQFKDLVEKSAAELVSLGFPLFALGSPVEFLENYEYKLLVEMILAARSRIPVDKPLHLFGAGHPLTFALAVALGCDLFDSASYILYAREGRYMTPSGTARLGALGDLPCVCPVCTKIRITELRSLDRSAKIEALAIHNLYVLMGEMKAVKQAVREGRLWEYVASKAKCHPSLWQGFQAMKDSVTYLEDGTPSFKSRAPFQTDLTDLQRPEVWRHLVRLGHIRPQTCRATLVLIPETEDRPFYQSSLFEEVAQAVKGFEEEVQVWFVSYSLGPIPVEVSDVYPLSQYVSSLGPSSTEEVVKECGRRVVTALEGCKYRTLIFLDPDRKNLRLAESLVEGGVSGLIVKRELEPDFLDPGPRG